MQIGPRCDGEDGVHGPSAVAISYHITLPNRTTASQPPHKPTETQIDPRRLRHDSCCLTLGGPDITIPNGIKTHAVRTSSANTVVACEDRQKHTIQYFSLRSLVTPTARPTSLFCRSQRSSPSETKATPPYLGEEGKRCISTQQIPVHNFMETSTTPPSPRSCVRRGVAQFQDMRQGGWQRYMGPRQTRSFACVSSNDPQRRRFACLRFPASTLPFAGRDLDNTDTFGGHKGGLS